MIKINKLIIFDLDGVLVDSKLIHYEALNKAIFEVCPDFIISQQDQEKIYEGLPTGLKLKILSENKGMPQSFHEEISLLKQKFTKEMLNGLQYDEELVSFFELIKTKNINIAVASNSIRATIDQCLTSLGIIKYIDYIASNEDVKNPKPHPEIYWKTMSHFGLISDETLIFEDSIVGKMAATDSKAVLIEVKNRKDLDINKIEKAISMLEKTRCVWKEKTLNVLIHIAGAGSRFVEAGYTFPKPLIEVKSKPMIQAVVENLSIDAKYTYIVQKSHNKKYNLEYLLNAITPGCNIVEVDGITEGAAATALLAKDFINNENPLIMANSDQIVDWNSREFIYSMYSKNADGGIATFKSSHPKWSYAKTDDFNKVIEVAEKKPISNEATVGIYAEQMIEKNLRVNNEFYVCPVFNEAINDNKHVYTFPVKKMWGIGTP